MAQSRRPGPSGRKPRGGALIAPRAQEIESGNSSGRRSVRTAARSSTVVVTSPPRSRFVNSPSSSSARQPGASPGVGSTTDTRAAAPTRTTCAGPASSPSRSASDAGSASAAKNESCTARTLLARPVQTRAPTPPSFGFLGVRRPLDPQESDNRGAGHARGPRVRDSRCESRALGDLVQRLVQLRRLDLAERLRALPVPLAHRRARRDHAVVERLLIDGAELLDLVSA